MITEEEIYKVLQKMEAEDFEDSFAEDQEEFWQYLNSDGFKGLSAEENQLSFFLNSVVYHCVKYSPDELPEFDIEFFQEIEEANWDEREKHKNWAETKDSYFKDFDEEDLLAFVEDMLADDEEQISDLSKEVLFITTLSYIEYLLIFEQEEE